MKPGNAILGSLWLTQCCIQYNELLYNGWKAGVSTIEV